MSRSVGVLVASLALSAVLAIAPRAHAQACCAGSAAVTPARLGLHEDALVGTTFHAGTVLGSFAPDGTFASQPPGTREVDLEEDILAAVRVTSRGQLAVLVPVVETYRQIPGRHEWGGGVGDVNVGGRYDFLRAGESRFIPGIALLAGLTLPTGTPVAASTQPLATDATGIGAFQGNVGVALEQTWNAWLVSLSGLLAQRASYTADGVQETLGTQLTALGAVAYTLESDAALGLVVSYAAEGNATQDGVTNPDSHKRALTLSGVGLYPINDSLRLQGSVFVVPPVSQLGANQTATLGLTLTLLLGFT